MLRFSLKQVGRSLGKTGEVLREDWGAKERAGRTGAQEWGRLKESEKTLGWR